MGSLEFLLHPISPIAGACIDFSTSGNSDGHGWESGSPVNKRVSEDGIWGFEG